MLNHTAVIMAVSYALLFAPSVLLAAMDEHVQTLPEVTVIGKKVGQSSVSPSFKDSKETIRRIPGGATVISKDSYATGRASTPQDILGWVPGVHVQQRDTASLESRISIRGSGLQRTFHLRGINLLQDGIPLNQTDGGGDAQRIEPLAVDYVEVYRGGNALRYGATTLGGAINFVSPTGYTADAFQARFELGSFGYIRSQVSSGQVLGKADYYASVSQFKQDGFRNHTNQDNYNLFSNVGWKLTNKVETRLYTTFIEAKSKLGGGLTKSQLYGDSTQPNLASLIQNRKRDFEFLRLASKTTISGEEDKLDLIGYWSSYDLFHPISPIIYQDDDDIGGEVRYSNTADRFGKRNDLVVGFGGAMGFMDDDRYNNVGGEPVGRAAEFDNVAKNLNLYGEDSFYVLDRLALVSGLQLVYSTREVDDFFFSNGDDSGYKIYRSVNPKAGVLCDLTESSQFFFNYNKSFEPPSFSEMTNPAGDFRPNKGQVSHTLEGGMRGNEKRFGWDATYYYSWIDNELLSLNDAAGNSLGTVNAPSKTIHGGVELGLNVVVLEKLLASAERTDTVTVRTVYNLSDFRFDGDPAFGDNQLPAFPEHFFKSELIYEHPCGIYFGPNLEASFSRYPIDMANTFFADRYMVFGFKAGYRTKKGTSFFFEGKNIFDETYAASTGIVTNAIGNDSAQFNPGAGQSWFGGIEWRY